MCLAVSLLVLWQLCEILAGVFEAYLERHDNTVHPGATHYRRRQIEDCSKKARRRTLCDESRRRVNLKFSEKYIFLRTHRITP